MRGREPSIADLGIVLAGPDHGVDAEFHFSVIISLCNRSLAVAAL